MSDAPNTLTGNAPSARPTIPVRAWAASRDPEVMSTEELLAFSSCAPHAPWWTRHDPFYEREIYGQPTPSWRFEGRFVESSRCGPDGRMRSIRVRRPAFTALAPHLAEAEHTKRAIAALIQYHHLSTGQLAALGGWDPNRAAKILTPLWRTGLLERCRLDASNHVGLRSDDLWQLLLRRPGSDRVNRVLRDWLVGLSEEERELVTLGVDPLHAGAGRRHLRHNLLATELAVRVAELLPTVASTWGEALCTPAHLLPDNHRAQKARFRADLGILREDGYRIIVEITMAGPRDRSVGEKMLRWGRLLSDHSRNDSGLIVVFLNASPSHHPSTAQTLRRCHAEYLCAERLGEPGMPALHHEVRRARSHIVLGSWREWFPGPWTVSDRFARLSCAFRLGDDQWRYTDVLDPKQTPFAPSDPMRWMLALIPHHFAAAHPSWALGPIASRAPDVPSDAS